MQCILSAERQMGEDMSVESDIIQTQSELLSNATVMSDIIAI